MLLLIAVVLAVRDGAGTAEPVPKHASGDPLDLVVTAGVPDERASDVLRNFGFAGDHVRPLGPNTHLP